MISNELSIHALANASWVSGLPPAKPAQESDLEANLTKLSDITRTVKAALNGQQTQADALKVAERCWQYATHIPDSRLSLLACQICKENLPEQGLGSLDRRNRTGFVIVVGGERLALPGYYQKILSAESHYFKALFEGNFNEKQTGTFRIEEIESRHFNILLDFLADGEFEAKEMELKDLIDLLIVAERLQLNNASEKLVDLVVSAIQSFDQTEDHLKSLNDIHSALEQTSIRCHPKLQKAIEEYFRKITEEFSTIDELLAHTEKSGITILSLDLRKFGNLLQAEHLRKLINYCPNLYSLFIKSNKITDLELMDLKELRSLNLGICALTDSDLAHLKELKSLTSLCLSYWVNLRGEGLIHLKELKNLTSLTLEGCEQLTDQGLIHLKKLKSLTSLRLPNCTNLTDNFLTHIKELKSLTSLDLSCRFNLTGSGLIHLKELKSLTSLNLSGNEKLTDNGLAHLKDLRSLTSLNLAECNKLTDQGLAHLKELKSLTSLNLSFWKQLRDEGLIYLKELRNLRSLTLERCNQLKDQDFIHLKELKNLTSLDLAYCGHLTDSSLIYLKELKSLTSLDLSFWKNLRDKDLAHLKELESLTDLDLRGCYKLTDQGLARLKELKSLTSLNLAECNKLTDQGLAQLKERVNLTLES